jgi:tetratricopeptide (TPR) repeat protein
MTRFVLAWLYEQIGDIDRSLGHLLPAQKANPSYLFPSRSFEALILEWAMLQPGSRRNAAYGLGNLYYDRQRHADAVKVWEVGLEDDPEFAPLFRNLGFAYWNKERNPGRARRAYERAVELAPGDARLIYEFDQLRKRMNDSPEERFAWLAGKLAVVCSRDDFCIEYLSLLNLTEQYEDALALMTGRRFHPWEGGEGKVLTQYQIAHVSLGRKHLEQGNALLALQHFDAAGRPPVNLGEEFHYLQSKADLNYWKGRALSMLGRSQEAQEAYAVSAKEAQDFKEMTLVSYAPSAYYCGLSLLALGQDKEAQELFSAFRQHAENLKFAPAKIDYFATSLPNMLIFEEDLAQRNQIEGLFLQGLSFLQSADRRSAQSCFRQVLNLDCSHLQAREQLRALGCLTFSSPPVANPQHQIS